MGRCDGRWGDVGSLGKVLYLSESVAVIGEV